MSRAKLFNMVKSRGENKTGRNPFDLTNRHVYSQKASKITPIKVFHTYPDDYLEVNLSEFTQNKVPLNTAAFLSGKKEHLAYFVPYNTIWHNYNQFQATREDPESTLLYDKGISYEPRFSLASLYQAALYFCIGDFLITDYLLVHALVLFHQDYIHDGHIFDEQLTIPELISWMQSHSHSAKDPNYTYYDEYLEKALHDIKTSDKILVSWNQTPFRIGFNCYESEVLDQDVRYYDSFTNMFGSSIWCDWVQKLDMLGYGNIYPVLSKMRQRCSKWLDMYLYGNETSQVDSQTLNVTVDSHNYSLWQSYDFFTESFAISTLPPGLSDIINDAFSVLESMSFDPDTQLSEYVNVYALYAYNKCFYDYMRNVYYDTDYSVYNYNCDFIDGSSLDGSIIDLGHVPLRFYHIEPHQWKKDMFTGVLPDNQLGQVSEIVFSNTIPSETVNVVTDGNNSYLDNFSDPAEGSDLVFTSGELIGQYQGNETSYSHTHNVSVPVSGHTLTNSLNVLALKRAEAIQEYRQDLMRAGNRTQDIFKQVYGTTPKSELDEMPYFIEVSANDLNINPIISTAQTGDGINQSLGDIAARCTIGGSELHFKFSTKDFGVILFLSYIVPDSFYNSYRLDPCVTHLDQEAHGLPYFQNLGLQPVIGSFLSNLKPSSVRNRTIGFAPPYIERKTDIDLVHGDFVDAYLPESSSDYDDDYQGEMSHWVVARTDMQQEDTVSLRNFYIDPRVLDNVFTFDSGNDYSTDQFFSYCTIKINAVRAFSELGLPRF